MFFGMSTFMHQQVPIRKRVELQFLAIGSSDLLQVVVCLRRSSSVIAMIVFLRVSTQHACVLSALFRPCMYWKGRFVYGQQVWSRFKGIRQQCSQGSWGISCCMRQQWHGSDRRNALHYRRDLGQRIRDSSEPGLSASPAKSMLSTMSQACARSSQVAC